MMHVYVTEKALENMALMTRWNKILSCRDVYEVFIDATEKDLIQYENNNGYDFSPISQLISDGSIHPNAAKLKIEEIKNNPSKVLEDPCAVYFLDVTKEEAAHIQKQYGVIFRNENDIDDAELSDWSEIISCKDEKNHNWTDFLAKIKQTPTNTIVISDRFIFSNDVSSPEWNCPGIDNIVDILDAVLPTTFSKMFNYHVLVLYSDTKPDGKPNCKISFNKLSKKLYKQISELRKEKYNILVEVVSIPGNSYGYEWTHNRRIITNYHIIRTEQDLKAFSENKSTCSQTLNWDALFSKGIMDKNDTSYKKFKILLANLKEINKYGKERPESSMYKYAYDGICPKSIKDKNRFVFSEIQNRLVINTYL